MGKGKQSKPSAAPAEKPPRIGAIDEMRESGADLDAIMSVICNNLDKSIKEILKAVERETAHKLNRAQPYELLRRAAAAGRLHYVAPVDYELSHKLRERYEWLRKARVVRTVSATDVAYHTALLLLEFTRQWEKEVLHMGVAGGGLMADAIRLWAGFLRHSGPLKLKRLFLHSLVAAADDPRRSPNGFVQWLLEGLPFQTEFCGLPAPAFLSAPALKALRHMEGLREAFDHAEELDLVVTSAGAHWDRGCSGLYNKYEDESKEALSALKEAGCIGDLIWRPFGPHGPILTGAGKHAVTLLDLEELPRLVGTGTRVMLALGPCGGGGSGKPRCGQPKNELLKAVLGWTNGITDLVADARAVALALDA